MAEIHRPDVYPPDERITQPSHQLLSDYDETCHDPNIHLASVAEKKRLWWRNAVVNASFIASWFFFATILSIYNKWMFSPEHFGFPSPLFVTTLHMFVQFLLAALIRAIWPGRFRPQRTPTRADYATKAVPTAIATGLDIGLSNLSLKTITLSFYTMCKSSSLIFVLTFAFLFNLETFSLRLIGVILLIFTGVLLMVATETHFVLSGFILVISASALGGLRWSLTQILLKNKKMGLNNPAATIFWLAPIMGLTLAIPSVGLDNWAALFGTGFFDGFRTTLNTTFLLTAPGVVAFCMVMSEFYIIQRVGVVPMSIAGIAKEVTTITLSAWFFDDELTPLNITGVAITVCGIALFTYHKYSKSIGSTVPLDAHGNPIGPEDEFPSSADVDQELGQHVELDETEHLGSSRSHLHADFNRDDTSHDDHPQLLFSAEEEGEEDAEEFRSIRSSKIDWDSADHGMKRDGAAEGDAHLLPVASVERAWEREELPSSDRLRGL